MATGADALEELLAEAGVAMGKPDVRRALAVRLHNEGCSADDLSELQSWAFRIRKAPHKVGQWLGWATATAPRWKDTLEQVRKLKAKAKQQDPMPNQPAGATPADNGPDWQRGMAWCRVRADRAPVAVVARELGVTEARVQELIAEELRRRDQEAIAREQAQQPNDDEDF